MNVPAKTFAAVLDGSQPVQRIAEDRDHLAFLSPTPVVPGHTLVITRTVEPYLFALPPGRHAALWAFAQQVAERLRLRLPCERVCVSVIGWEVRHVHIHLLPTQRGGEVPGLPGQPADPGALAALARRLAD